MHMKICFKDSALDTHTQRGRARAQLEEKCTHRHLRSHAPSHSFRENKQESAMGDFTQNNGIDASSTTSSETAPRRLEVGATSTPLGHSLSGVCFGTDAAKRPDFSKGLPGRSSLLDRLDAFLPSLKRANEALPESAEERKKIEIDVGLASNSSAESSEGNGDEKEDESGLIEMNIALLPIEGDAQDPETFENQILENARKRETAAIESLQMPAAKGGDGAAAKTGMVVELSDNRSDRC